MSKWLILDRDGVINHDSDDFIKSPQEWRPLPGSLEAIAELNQAGYKIAVISNQSGIARGLFDLTILEQIQQKFSRLLAEHKGEIEQFYFCPHGPDNHCECRKPKPGMFKQFASDHQLNLDDIYAVGDSIRDLQAAQSAGSRAILVETGKGSKSVETIAAENAQSFLKQVPVYPDLAAFKRHLLT